MMRYSALFIMLLSALCQPHNAAAETANTETKKGIISETVRSEKGDYSVSINSLEKKVEVTKVSGNTHSPPYLRMRIMRQNDRPLELHLRTLEKDPSRYAAPLGQWNEGSYLGLQLEFSFDRKTWSRIGNALTPTK